jgi:hypothetical protein
LISQYLQEQNARIEWIAHLILPKAEPILQSDANGLIQVDFPWLFRENGLLLNG